MICDVLLPLILPVIALLVAGALLALKTLTEFKAIFKAMRMVLLYDINICYI
jgi:hypothetical protein